MNYVKFILCMLLLLNIDSNLHAQGIGPPAGMGGLMLMVTGICIVAVLLIAFIIYTFYKKVENKKRYLYWVSGVIVLMGFLSSVGVNFVSYTVIENQPLVNPIEINAYKDGYYLELADGNLYKFKRKYQNNNSSLSEDKYLQKGGSVMLEGPRSDGTYLIRSKGESSEYYWYKREKAEKLVTLPFRFHDINRYVQKYEGNLVKLNPDWRADENDLVKALTKNECCDVLWIQELLKRGANEYDVINEKKLLHRFISHTKKINREKYKAEVTKVLLDAGANINLLDDFGRSYLHMVIRKMPAYKKAELSDADRSFLQLMLDRGADPDSSFYDGVSILTNTIVYRQYDILELLILNGADVHKQFGGRDSAFNRLNRLLVIAQKRNNEEDMKVFSHLVQLMDSSSP